MKCFWHTWLAIVATTAIISTAHAQSGWNQSSEIGSYQSILARAGYQSYDTPAPSTSAVPGQVVDNGQVVNDQPMGSPPMMSQSMQSGCDSAVAGSGGGCSESWSDGSVYGRTGGMASRLGGGSDSNYVFGARALFLRRDHEDDVPLTRNAAGDVLRSTSADMGLMGGVDLSLIKRNCNGNGIEFGYWGLYPGEQDASIAGPGLDSYLLGFNGLGVAPGNQNLLNYYNNSDSNRIYRTNRFNNAEVNFLRNAGSFTTRGGRCGNFEMLGGLRWFQFDENFRYSAFYATANPSQVDYNLSTDNTLLGFQVGGRNNYCVSDRLSLISSAKVGVFNNYITHNQNILDNNGVYAYRTAAGVDDYNYDSSKNDLSMLGELDFGMAYRFSQCARATFGYRIMGVSGIALAPSQIPSNFNNEAEINDINSNDSLILGGGYAGLEFCY